MRKIQTDRLPSLGHNHLLDLMRGLGSALLVSGRSKMRNAGSRRVTMPTKQPEEFEYLSNNPDYVADPDIEEFMEQEISRAPKDPELLAHRLRNNTAASPRDSGGDLDAAWEDVNESGSETVAGDNPTPDQSLVEENARALGVSFEDNQELDFEKQIEKRDRDRFELNEGSKMG